MGSSSISNLSSLSLRSSMVGQLLKTVSSSDSSGVMLDPTKLMSTVTISRYGGQINSIYNSLKQISDGAEREAAMDGMRGVLLDLIQNPSNDKWSSFILTADRVAGANLDVLSKVFVGDESESAEAEATASPAATVDLYGKISSSDLSGEFSSAALDLIRSDGTSAEKDSGFRELMSLTAQVLDADLSSDERAAVSEALFSGLSEAGTVADKRAFMADFSIEDVLNPPETDESANATSDAG